MSPRRRFSRACGKSPVRLGVGFLTDESCGKCVPCREGLRQMHRLLTKICEGKGEPGDIEALEDLSETAEEASLCALGKSAPSPFRSTLEYFRHEYEAHVHEKRCPALACKELTSFYIDPELCKACLICGRNCPSEAIVGAKKQSHFIDQDKCNGCGTCLDVCPPKFNAVKKISGEPVPAPLPEEQRTC